MKITLPKGTRVLDLVDSVGTLTKDTEIELSKEMDTAELAANFAATNRLELIPICDTAETNHNPVGEPVEVVEDDGKSDGGKSSAKKEETKKSDNKKKK